MDGYKELVLSIIISQINKEIIEIIRTLDITEDEINDFFERLKDAKYNIKDLINDGDVLVIKDKGFLLEVFEIERNLILKIFKIIKGR
jgi:hypothetical protein